MTMTLLGTPDQTTWPEILPIWVLDVLDDMKIENWRQRFEIAERYRGWWSSYSDEFVIYFTALPGALMEEIVTIEKLDADLLYDRRLLKVKNG
jgi:hypothetical protein